MILERQGGKQGERDECRNGPKVPSCVHARNQIQPLSFFPTVSNYSGRGSGLTGYKISRPYGPSEVGGVGEVLSLIFSGKEGCVASRGRRSPCGVFLLANENRERVASINSINCPPRDVVTPYQVDNSHSTIVDFDSRQPKHYCAAINQEGRKWNRSERASYSIISDKKNQSQGHYKSDEDGNYSAESRPENLHDSNLSAEVMS